MKNLLTLSYSKKVLMLCSFILLQVYSVHSQIIIEEVKAVYKSKVDGRIISEKEFQSYRGTHVFHRLIKGKQGTRDTIVITPPKTNLTKVNDSLSKSILGEKIKPFSVVDLYGNEISSDKLKGKVVVMNFWFVACPPCVQEMPELNELVDAYKDNPDVVFLGFAKDSEALLGKFLSKSEFNYAIIPNATEIAKLYNISAYPTHVIINKKGIVNAVKIGIEENIKETLNNDIEKLL